MIQVRSLSGLPHLRQPVQRPQCWHPAFTELGRGPAGALAGCASYGGDRPCRVPWLTRHPPSLAPALAPGQRARLTKALLASRSVACQRRGSWLTLVGAASSLGGGVSLDPLTTGLLLGGWVIAFLLGKELQTGYAVWRARNSGRPRSR